jgi:hypothetical protein
MFASLAIDQADSVQQEDKPTVHRTIETIMQTVHGVSSDLELGRGEDVQIEELLSRLVSVLSDHLIDQRPNKFPILLDDIIPMVGGSESSHSVFVAFIERIVLSCEGKGILIVLTARMGHVNRSPDYGTAMACL